MHKDSINAFSSRQRYVEKDGETGPRNFCNMRNSVQHLTSVVVPRGSPSRRSSHEGTCQGYAPGNGGPRHGILFEKTCSPQICTRTFRRRYTVLCTTTSRRTSLFRSGCTSSRFRMMARSVMSRVLGSRKCRAQGD